MFYIALEVASQGELFHIIQQSGAFDERLARFYFHEIIAGIQHCHEKGFVHRDLKMENFLLDTDYRIKLADFGFSTFIEGTNGFGEHQTYLGTRNYMAPEIIENKPYDARSTDLFAAGVVLFQMVFGNLPFYEANREDAYYRPLAKNNAARFW